MHNFNINILEKILIFLLYCLPIALISSSFASDFCVSVSALIFIILALYKKEWFYFNNRLFFFF